MNEAASHPESSASRPARIGEVCAIALLAAAVAALPTALRTGAVGGSALDGWVVGMAVWLCLCLPVVSLRHKAARGWRGVLGADPPDLLGPGLALWAGMSVTLLVAMGAVLKATTHHRGLGGATFGVFGLALVLVAAVIAVRLAGLGQRLLRRGVSARALSWGAAAVALVVPLGVVASSMLGIRSAGPPASQLVAAVVDALLALAALGLLMTRGLPRPLRRPGQLAAVPLVVCVWVVGFVRVEWSEGVAAHVRAGGGVPAVALGLLERWTDRDGDGAGAHFGGRDCDEGDAARHPGAADRAGDGIDGDCDGTDGPSAKPAVSVAVGPDRPVDSSSTQQSAAPPDAAASPTRLASAVTPTSRSAAGDSAAPGAAPERPDVILVTLDSVGARHSSTYGYDKKTTPTLTALAGRGVLFEHAYAIGATTQRALTPLVTSRALSASRRSADEWFTLLDENETVAERLKKAGYATGAVTSFTWLRQDRGFHQGFDLFDESAFRADHPEHSATGEQAVAVAAKVYRSLAERKEPLFLWVHLFDAHSKYLAHPGLDFGDGEVGRYDSEVAFVDQRLGDLVRSVDEGPRAGRTLWVVHGSHGEAFGEHGYRGHGQEIYDESIAVPLMVAGVWVPAAKYGARAVSTLDIAPTILDYAGASRSDAHGVSLRKVVEGDLSFERAPVLAHAPRRTCLIEWPLKLLLRHRKEQSARRLLFDLQSDPDERRDVSGDRREDLARLGATLAKAESS